MNDVQGRILALYKVAKQICEKHDIPYYAIGGTAIGAVRHNGFIPWDDDLDIAIPIEHFWEFFDYAKEELPLEGITHMWLFLLWIRQVSINWTAFFSALLRQNIYVLFIGVRTG